MVLSKQKKLNETVANTSGRQAAFSILFVYKVSVSISSSSKKRETKSDIPIQMRAHAYIGMKTWKVVNTIQW